MLNSATCARCLANALARTRRRFFDWPLMLLGFAPARCTNCGYRSYRRRA